MRCGGNCRECHWCSSGTVTDVVPMFWDVFTRLGVDQAWLSDPFQLSKTAWGRKLLSQGRGVAATLAGCSFEDCCKTSRKTPASSARPPAFSARPPASTRTSTATTSASVPGYASSPLPGSGRIEETGGRDVRDSHPYPAASTPTPPPARPRSTT